MRALVAEIRGDVCGYCLFHINDGKPSAYLHSLAITPEMKRQGLGRLLLGAAESEAVRVGRRLMRVDVRMDSPEAKLFYESAGYRFVSVKTVHYEDGSSATRMDKRIAGREFGKAGRLVEKVVCAAAAMLRRRLR
ncbi:MAG: GNAT family N-acetyltransferase [Mesorhizobium sp.]|nr:GNAT family N-acetyltransferase [Mesorhizobium sp.]